MFLITSDTVGAYTVSVKYKYHASVNKIYTVFKGDKRRNEARKLANSKTSDGIYGVCYCYFYTHIYIFGIF